MSFLSLARTIVVMLLIMLPMFWVLDKYYEAEDEFHKNLLAQFEVGMKHQDVITALNQFELQKVPLFFGKNMVKFFILCLKTAML